MQRRFTLRHYLAAALVACAASALLFALNKLLTSLDIPSQIEFLNELLIGVCAGIATLMLMKYREERLSRAREKMILVSELNHHIRNAVTLLGQSAALPDSPEKLRMIDAAVDRVDRVLTELVPTANTTDTPRLFLEDRPEGLGSKRKS